jgi:hypothetical protein
MEVAQIMDDDLPPRGDDDQVVQIRRLSQSREFNARGDAFRARTTMNKRTFSGHAPPLSSFDRLRMKGH